MHKGALKRGFMAFTHINYPKSITATACLSNNAKTLDLYIVVESGLVDLSNNFAVTLTEQQAQDFALHLNSLGFEATA